MPSHTSIFNVTRGFYLKRNQALKAIDNCACTWVEYGESVRDLTLAESIAARNVQAQTREPIASAEIPGLIFQPPINAASTAFQRSRLIRDANQFCEMAHV